ncbi:MAG: 50S ribosomal protein L21, partial [Armatimonadota bacterium]|nr:50S ribosomal protein L21 [Armatimonadota bacterium]MDW8026186.1 50S ribosomal protein L21 [Armatimonadota bacterium]
MKVAAVIEACGRQYHVEPNMEIDLDLIELPEGEEIEISKVLLIRADGKTIVGTPYVDGAKVVGKVLKHYRGRKIIVFKYRPKKRYRRKHGHRQWF